MTAKGDQYVFIAMAGTQKAIISYRIGKRDSDNTDHFIRDLRQRVLGLPEISSDGFKPYLTAIRDAFGKRVAHGVVSKTYSVVHLNVNEASRRYSPAQVIAVEHDVVSGVPSEISTSYAERGNLSLRMACRRFTRLTNAFSFNPMPSLILKRASASRPSGDWNDDDFDVLEDAMVVGRIFRAAASPVGTPWMWTLAFGHHEDRTPTHGYTETREAAMAAFAKSWRRE